MPTIFDLEESNLSAESKHLKLSVSAPRKSPTKRVYQQDQFKLFEEYDANFPNYIRLEGERTFNILEELKQLEFKKKRILLYNVIRYSLLLRCNSFTNIPIINERVSISILASAEKIQ